MARFNAVVPSAGQTLYRMKCGGSSVFISRDLTLCNYEMSIWIEETGAQHTPPPGSSASCKAPLINHGSGLFMFHCASGSDTSILICAVQTSSAAIVYQPLSCGYKRYISVTSCCRGFYTVWVFAFSFHKLCVFDFFCMSARSLTAYQKMRKFCAGDSRDIVSPWRLSQPTIPALRFGTGFNTAIFPAKLIKCTEYATGAQIALWLREITPWRWWGCRGYGEYPPSQCWQWLAISYNQV